MSKQRVLDMNEQLDEQLDRIKQMNRTANETQETSNNIMKELGDQREKMNRQVDMNRNIKDGIKQAKSKTNSMRRRNICIKLMLYLVVLILFLTILGLVVFKISKT